MKDLKVILDLKTETWFIENLQDFNPVTEVLFNVKQINPQIIYDNLKFGFVLKLNGNPIQSVSEPTEGTTYISSDQSYLKSIPIDVIYNRTYDIDLWVENGGKRYERIYNFTTPKPEQPFDSWIWNEESECWQPPVAKADGEENYVWIEKLRQWMPSTNTNITLPEKGIWNPKMNQWEEVPDYDVE